jgi:GT2 family glycosyltransferase
MMMKRKSSGLQDAVFLSVQRFWNQNGFDERFFAHQEEIDLCWRLINSGRKFIIPENLKFIM